MSEPIEEQVMVALIQNLQAIVDGSNNVLFPTVVRGRIVSQSFTNAAKNLPAVSVYRIIDRESTGNRTFEKSKILFAFGCDIVGSKTTQPTIDTELIELKSYVKKSLLNQTLGGLVGTIEYRGSDTSNFAPIAQGREIVAFETLMALNKTDPWSQA